MHKAYPTTPAELTALTTPPKHLGPALTALWLVRHNQWEAAHQLVQNAHDAESAWVHAHLHRKEGDDTNAAYWYAKAGRKPCSLPLEIEWEQIAQELLRHQHSNPL